MGLEKTQVKAGITSFSLELFCIIAQLYQRFQVISNANSFRVFRVGFRVIFAVEKRP